MTCRHTQELLAAFLEGDLDAATRDQLDVHLAGCNDCSEEFYALQQVDRLLKNVNVIHCPDGMWETLNQRMMQAPRPRVLPRSQNQLAPAWSLAVAAALLAFAWNPQQAGRLFVVHSDTQPAVTRTAAATPVLNRPSPGVSQQKVAAPVVSAVTLRPSVQPAKPAPPASPPALMIKPAEPAAMIPTLRAPIANVIPPAQDVTVNPVAAQDAPVSPPVQPVSRPVMRLSSRRFLSHSRWNPSLAVLRTGPMAADVQSSRSLAGVEVVAPTDDNNVPSPEPINSTSVNNATVNSVPAAVTTVAATPAELAAPVEDATVQGTAAVAAQTQSDDADALEQARKDMYGMSLEAGGTTMTASLPPSAGV